MFTIGLKKSEAEYLMDKAKSRYEMLIATVKREISNARSKKKLTIPQIEAKAKSDKRVRRALNEYNEAKYIYNVTDIAFKYIKEKGQQMTNLAMNYRKELEHGYIKESKGDRVNHKMRDKSVKKRSK